VKKGADVKIGGGGASNQFTNADTILEDLGFDPKNFQRVSGDGEKILSEVLNSRSLVIHF